MANFSTGPRITFPSPQPLQYTSPIVGMTCFTPNSTSSTNNLMFPSPPSSSSLNREGVGGILCSASNSRPTTSHCLTSSRQMSSIQWAPTSVASPEMTMFNTAAANFSSLSGAPASPVPSTSGISQNSSLNKSKRKADLTDLPTSEEPEQKILVNEERMAARMQELHLDNNNLDWHPDLEHQQQRLQEQRYAESWYTRDSARSPDRSPSPDSQRVILTNCSTSSSEDYDSDSSSMSSLPQPRRRAKSCPKLDFSPELQLTLKTQRLLPKVILDELNKPCMQVMLWKPPGGVEDIMAGVEAATKQSSVVKEPHLSIQVSAGSSRSQDRPKPSIWAIPAGRDEDADDDVDDDVGGDIDDDMEL